MAIKFGANFGLPLVEQANSLYFRPYILGGDKVASVRYYERAFAYYKQSDRNHWMYYNVGAWLGQVYIKQSQYNKAEVLLTQLLHEAPDFKWVKDELLPLLLREKRNG
jgi:tetratricopeptide (TPR) repeat protein